MKVNFRHLSVRTSFEGEETDIDVAKALGNLMMYNGSVLLDIGFEDLAKDIYYSEGEVEVPERYAHAVKQVVMNSQLPATVKRTIRDLMDKKQ